jgi:hypothetical protein
MMEGSITEHKSDYFYTVHKTVSEITRRKVLFLNLLILLTNIAQLGLPPLCR